MTTSSPSSPTARTCQNGWPASPPAGRSRRGRSARARSSGSESKVFGLAIPSAYEVIRCDPPSVLTGRNTGLLTFSETYLLAPAPDGTEVSHTVEVDLAGRFMLLAPLVSLALRAQLRRDFAALKRVLEGAPGPAQASQAHSE
ncbi:MAG TPA: SRPBCC family protein [Dehalococcoidia bacterium]|nr:SRPBCC family protein [Dehalococcoidia bacterium]